MDLRQSLHFCPSDGYFGDPMPVYHNGIYHVYYTKLYSTDKPMSWGHISTTDFIHYTEHPDPFDALSESRSHITVDVRRVPFNTGCVYVDNVGVFHAFYAGLDTDKTPCMLHARSSDGIAFSECGEICFRRPNTSESGYRRDGTWRDPFVFYDDCADVYRMVFCAKAPEADGHPDCYAGVIGQAVSKDLEHWSCLSPMSLRGIGTTMECPEIFRYGDRWVLIYYWHETRFRTSLSYDGPWERGEVISPDRFDFMAARHMYDGKKHYLVGWLPRRNCDCMERIWGGNMLFVRELTFDGGTTPQTRFVGALETVFSKKDSSISAEKAVFCGPGWSLTEDGLHASAPVGGTIAAFSKIPDVCRITADLSMTDKRGQLTLFIGCHHAYSTESEYLDEGYMLILDASEGMIRLRRHYMWDQRNDIAVMPYSFCPSKPIHFEILRDRGILEICVDQKQTMVSRTLSDKPGGLAVSVQDTDAFITDLAVYTAEESISDLALQ